MTREEAIKKLHWFALDNRDKQIIDLAIEVLQDRPTGKWKAKSFHEFFCNNCEFSFDMMKCEFLESMKFCPNCGAKMERKEE